MTKEIEWAQTKANNNLETDYVWFISADINVLWMMNNPTVCVYVLSYVLKIFVFFWYFLKQ